MNYWLFSLPFIAACINWLAFYIALKLFFHPYLPKKIGWVKIQGILPKYKPQLADELGKIAEQELLSVDLENLIANPENLQQILPTVEEHIDHFLRVKLKESMPVISFFIGDKTVQQLKAIFMKELEELFPIIMKNYAGSIKHNIDIRKIITEKISNLPADQLEHFLMQKLSKQFRSAQLIAAGLGFLTGCIQILLNFLVK